MKEGVGSVNFDVGWSPSIYINMNINLLDKENMEGYTLNIVQGRIKVIWGLTKQIKRENDG